MKPNFRGSPNHDVVGPEPFFQPAVKALRHGPLPLLQQKFFPLELFREIMA
jgi:hypothetical protein